AKIFPGQPILRNDVLQNHVGRVKPPETGDSRPYAPFPHFLTEQGTRFPSDAIVPESSTRKCFAPKSQVDAQRDMVLIKLQRLSAVIQQGNYRPLSATMIREPVRSLPFPDWQHFAADIITIVFIDGVGSLSEPVRFDSHIVIGSGDDFA